MMLLSIGKCMLDIVVEVDNTFLRKYGLNPNDATKATETQSELFEDILKMNPKFIPGGSVTNTVRVFQWAVKERTKVFLMGVIGKDKFGHQIKLQLKNENIDYGFVENTKETIQCAVLISSNGKNRSLVTNSNLKSTQIISNKRITFDDFRERISECSFFYVPSFSLVMFADVIKEVVKHFKSNQKKIIFNLGATYILEKCSENVKYLIQHADVVIGNDQEYGTLAKILNIASMDLQSTLMEIKSRYLIKENNIFVVTRGDKDILVYNEEGFKYYKVDPVKQIVDTTGAGDAFAGGFLSQYVKNSSLESCVFCGIACAGNIIQHFGCNCNLDFNCRI